MKIAVLVKQVPDISELRFDPETRRVVREGVRTEVSAFDLRGLVRAVELAAESGGEVVALTMGPPQAREALVEAMALGADRGLHLVDAAFAGADTLATARALAAAIEREGFDLVIAGKSSVDAETGQVGPEVAELLGWPQVTVAKKLTVEPGTRRLEVERESDEGSEILRLLLPAVVTAGEDLAPERFAKRKDREAAATKPIEEIDAAALGGDPARFGTAGSPTWVDRIEILEEHREGKVLEGEGAIETFAASVRDAIRRAASGGEQPQPLGEIRSAPQELWVFAEAFGTELRGVTRELLGKADELAGRANVEVVAIGLGHGITPAMESLGRFGADRTRTADDPRLDPFDTETFTSVLVAALDRHKPWAVLFPSTALGRDLAPRVAARRGLGLTGDCIDLSIDAEGRLLQWKPAFGGNVVAPILTSTTPVLATVRPGMFAARGPDDARTLPSERHEPLEIGALPTPRVEHVERRIDPEAANASALDSATVSIGVGMGLGGPESLGVIRALATRIGASIAATRDVVDEGWLPRQHQVGLTGRAIAPAVYLGIGIRGAFEHMVGVRRAGKVFVVNPKAKAPVFRAADLGVVATWQEVLPVLERVLADPN